MTSTNTARRATALPPEERRAAIVRAVIPLLMEHGERVTTRQIAEAAGVAEGTIFRVFDDKDELIHAALDAALDQEPFEQALRDIEPGLDFEERLVAATDVIRRRVVMVWRLLSSLGPAARQHADRPLTDSAALVAIFESAPDRIRIEPAPAARLLRALTLSLTHPMLAGDEVSSPEIVEIVLRGVERR